LHQIESMVEADQILCDYVELESALV